MSSRIYNMLYVVKGLLYRYEKAAGFPAALFVVFELFTYLK